MLTLTDLFCGAGGSSTRAVDVPGVSVRVASNHWDLAVETHEANHPDTGHVCADLSQITGGTPSIEDCTFRMLTPSEIKQAVAFPDSYQILGTKRDQVRMAGNAVTPPAARDLVAAVAESLEEAS